MNFDYYVSLDDQKTCPKKVNEFGLVSGFADRCASSFAIAEIERAEAEEREKKVQKNSQEGKDVKKERKNAENRKNEARRCYMKRVSDLKDLKLPLDLKLEPDFTHLADPSWFGIEVKFELLSPWYSRDDRPFHVLDNPVRKDRVFGVPFMSAASWKGLLRWACRMEIRLLDYLKKHDMKLDAWKDPPWIVHLFGNEQVEGEEFSRGALKFYPTWFDKVDFEVINPHERKTKAGIRPIYYEVVPAETKGKLQLLYAPLLGETQNDKVKPADFIDSLIDSITALLETYGISAKRTAGWGAAKAGVSTLYFMEGSWMEQLVGSGCEPMEYTPPEGKFKALMDRNGYPIEILIDVHGNLLSKTQFKKLGDNKPDCTNTEFLAFKNWYEKYGEEYKRRLNGIEGSKRLPRTIKRSFDSLAKLKTILTNARKGGGQ